MAKVLEAHMNKELRGVPGGVPEEAMEIFRWFDREVLAEAIELFGAGGEEAGPLGLESMERNKPWP